MYVAPRLAPLNCCNEAQELPSNRARYLLHAQVTCPIVTPPHHDACPCRAVAQEFRLSSWRAGSWLAASIALIALQHLATALQLRSSLLGQSASLPRLPNGTSGPRRQLSAASAPRQRCSQPPSLWM
jgi:hypothetical protein